ncbi:MAG: hypothetical protein ACLVKO_06645 [Dysgonomonas sp.]
MEIISSLQNDRIKNIIKLFTKSKERKKQGLIVAEGARELSLAQNTNYEIDSVFVCTELYMKSDYPDVLEKINENKIYEVTLPVFQKIAYRENSDGIITLMKLPDNDLKKY